VTEWQPDPSAPDRYHYFDGRHCSATWIVRQGGGSGSYQLHGWHRVWFGRVARWPIVFYPLAWLDCSVPIARGHVARFVWPHAIRSVPKPGPAPR
jgi:hypothetical protein